MNNYGLRGFLIAFSVFFLLTFKGCSNAWSGTAGTDYFSLTILSIIVGSIIGAVGLLIGKQFKTEKQVKEKEFIVKNKKLIFILLPSILVLLYFFGRYNPLFSSSDKVTDNLQNNLGNLNGEWGYKNDKEDETWWLQICYNEDSKNGTYILSKKYDSWGENNDQKIKTVSEGPFTLIEGYDRYGDKAYVGKNSNTGNAVFAITQIENKYAVDWLLRISMIEDVMFGKHMSKLSNECK
jgi:hypothetical protein